MTDAQRDALSELQENAESLQVGVSLSLSLSLARAVPVTLAVSARRGSSAPNSTPSDCTRSAPMSAPS